MTDLITHREPGPKGPKVSAHAPCDVARWDHIAAFDHVRISSPLLPKGPVRMAGLFSLFRRLPPQDQFTVEAARRTTQLKRDRCVGRSRLAPALRPNNLSIQ